MARRNKTTHKIVRNRALAFANDMKCVLKGKRGLEWQIGTAESGTRECVDVIGWKNGKQRIQRVFIEVELRRIAPLGNVVKVWKQLTQKKPRKKLIMFQAFSLFYAKAGTQRVNAQFVGREMAKVCPVKYINYDPKISSGQAPC